MNLEKKTSSLLTLWLPVGLPILIFMGYFVFSVNQGSDSSGSGAKELSWRDLQDLDYRTGKTGPRVDQFNGKKIKLSGFVVPLDDESEGGSEFLFVPNPQACIHVPPPPPNQMVMVHMIKGKTPKRSWGPVSITGVISITETQSSFGKVSYKLLGEDSEVYKPRTNPR